MTPQNLTEQTIDELSKLHPLGYDLSLGRIERLLDKLENPHHTIPPVFHVAGTNGKGSTIANLRSILEQSGHRVHAHTSPHLVHYTERFRLASAKPSIPATSQFVSDALLAETLQEVAQVNSGQPITIFELLTAAMFVLFSRNPADFSLVEVGLGGRFDSTNVVAKPLVSIITPVSLDHINHLGKTVDKIAFEKAGIIKSKVPVVVGPQEPAALETIEDVARSLDAPLFRAGSEFDFYEQRGRLIYQDEWGLLDLPMPRLAGGHQMINSAVAIAATRIAGIGVNDNQFAHALESVYWPGRMQSVVRGRLYEMLPKPTETWIDGGHNSAAGQVIAAQMNHLDARQHKNLIMILGMMAAKDPKEFLLPFKDLEPQLLTVPISSSEHGYSAQDLAIIGGELGYQATPCPSVEAAIQSAQQIIRGDGQPLAGEKSDYRVLVCGSLYMIGEFLAQNQTPPQ